MNTPYLSFPPTEMMKVAYPDPESFYILWFQQRDVPEQHLDARTRQVFEKIFRRGQKPQGNRDSGAPPRANPFLDLDSIEPQTESVLDETELNAYTAAFERSGFFGPISWYRNIDQNRELVPGLGEQKLDLPALQVVAAWDAAIPPEGAELSRAKCSDIEVYRIEECGHWTQQDKPEELSGIMVDWLTRRFGSDPQV